MPPAVATPRRVTKNYRAHVLKATRNGDAGQVDAVVAVFGNTDYQGDRVTFGAFTNTLNRWKAAGDPIPVIFSHQWHDLDAHIGGVEPANALEVPAGDPRLPEAIRELGGLLVTMDLDLTEDGGRKAFKLLAGRRVREFSWGFDIVEEARAKDGANEITEVELYEVGPTLLGANPLTQLIGAKAGQGPGTKERPNFQTKAWVTLPNSLERLQESLRRAAIAWALDLYGPELYAVDIEATYTEEAILYVELWEDPPGKGAYYRATYTATDAAGVTLGDPELVTLSAVIEPAGPPIGATADEGDEASKRADRFRRKAGARNSAADLDRIQSIHDLCADLGAACASTEPEEATAEDPEDGKARKPAPAEIRDSINRQLAELQA